MRRTRDARRRNWFGSRAGMASGWWDRTASASSTLTRPCDWRHVRRRPSPPWWAGLGIAVGRGRDRRARSRPLVLAPVSRASSRSATRPTSAATTCWRTGTTTRPPARSRSTWSRSATRGDSPGSPRALARRKPVLAVISGRSVAAASEPVPRTRPRRRRPTSRSTPCSRRLA